MAIPMHLIGTNLGEGGGKWSGGVLGPDGKVYCVPCDARRVLRIDPATGATDLIGSDHGEGGKWGGGVLGPDGKVYCVPRNARRVLRIDPATGATDLIGTDHGEGGGKWNGGVLGPDGKVYCVPCNARRVLRIEPPVPRGWSLAASPMAPHEDVAPTTATAGGTGSDELLALRFQLEEERAARARTEAAAEARAAEAEARAVAAERELAALRAAPPPAAGRQVAVLTRAELEAATRGFDEGGVLGEGGFGKVYLAAALPPLAGAPHGFAVKRLRLDGMQGEEQLHNEVQLLSSCQHEALLPLAGVCLEREALCLVYPLMVGGSLEDRLLPAVGDAPRRLARLGLPSPPAALTWQCRLRAMRDVARVLAYLHAAAPGKPVMLHRDVKPANVLLDAQLNAKLADVGLARAEALLGPGGQTHHTTQNVMGSPGFIDPLYVETRQYSEVTDGYALGISLLMCLKPRSAVGLLDACVDALEDPTQEKVAAVVDPTWPADVALALMRVVIGLSWRRTRSRRMPIADAVRALEAVADNHDVRPGVSVVDEARECVVCLMEPRAVRFGCGHCACCTTCAGLLQAQRMSCPVCRLPIRRFMEEGSHLALQPTFVELQ
ncbi:hypothetical protein AB1Y20_008333 [Prymnesium parvum]|uniref:RING-type E3 ubiquitin transferase n=1 Tax=Prymnesium parvum TaxID=97485 RepID=A0AB34IUD8_PRYPA